MNPPSHESPLILAESEFTPRRDDTVSRNTHPSTPQWRPLRSGHATICHSFNQWRAQGRTLGLQLRLCKIGRIF